VAELRGAGAPLAQPSRILAFHATGIGQQGVALQRCR
jgi:hypothetical protein